MKRKNTYTDAELEQLIEAAKSKVEPVVDDYFFGRLKQRMQSKQQEPQFTLLRYAYNFKVAATIALFIINTVLISYVLIYRSSQTQVSDSAQQPEFEQEWVFEYTDLEKLAEVSE